MRLLPDQAGDTHTHSLTLSHTHTHIVDIHKKALANSAFSRRPEKLGNTTTGKSFTVLGDTFERVGSNSFQSATFSRLSSGSTTGSASASAAAEVTSASTESKWRETDDYNVREGCNIFENRIDTTQADIIEGFLRGPKEKNSRIVDAVSNILDEDQEWNIGKAIGEQTYLALLIGDWRRAFEGIQVTFGYVDVSQV